MQHTMKTRSIGQSIRAFLALVCLPVLAPAQNPSPDPVVEPDGVDQRTETSVLELDGKTASVSIANFGSIAPTHEITIEFWQNVSEAKVQAVFALVPENGQNRILAHTPWRAGRVFWDFGNIDSGRLSYMPPEQIVGTWNHFALVASQSQNAMRIIRNGILEAEKEGMTPFERGEYDLVIGGPEDLSGFATTSPPLFGGRLAEFRVWDVARSVDQILDGMFVKLTGDEPDLVGVWNFDDGTATDSSPHGNHGQLKGQARIVAASRPPRGERNWSRVTGTITDADGDPVPDVTLHAESAGTRLASARTSESGKYSLTLWTTHQVVDLGAHSTNRWGAGSWKSPSRPGRRPAWNPGHCSRRSTLAAGWLRWMAPRPWPAWWSSWFDRRPTTSPSTPEGTANRPTRHSPCRNPSRRPRVRY